MAWLRFFLLGKLGNIQSHSWYDVWRRQSQMILCCGPLHGGSLAVLELVRFHCPCFSHTHSMEHVPLGASRKRQPCKPWISANTPFLIEDLRLLSNISPWIFWKRRFHDSIKSWRSTIEDSDAKNSIASTKSCTYLTMSLRIQQMSKNEYECMDLIYRWSEE